ncbi:hypothetical protein [Salinicoccus sp. YB14-2]|uniref:hypothetical protein n=1 Tax=Salinicoccus sp. YB14-2 TaxID=1572701 RepID=UPI000B3091F4|nr:hypothetical protein [Salinicoccus sp. YB14-2]
MANINESFNKRPLKVKGQPPVIWEGGAEVLTTDVPKSFWAGFDQYEKTLNDKYHP